jgi:hypothetical protein
MNERIRELAEQAETKEIGYYFFDREKFAELIINECADIAGHPAPGAYTSIGHQIKKHFGVEE